MKKTISQQDQQFITEFKKLTPEQKETVAIAINWLKDATRAESKAFGELIASKDQNAIEAFIESLRNKFASPKMGVAAI